MNYSKYVINARNFSDNNVIYDHLSTDNIAHAIEWMEDKMHDGLWIEIQQPKKAKEAKK